MYHKSSNDHANADALSRLPLSEVPENILLPAEIILSMELIASSPVTHVQIQTWTKSDNIISQVLQFVKYGWPDTCPSDELKPYWIRQNELSLVDGCIMWASRVVVPKPGRQILLHELHKGHFGISKAKSRARSCIWWPGIDVDIEKTVKQCESCQQTRNSPPLHQWPWPSRPWSRLHIDFVGPFNKMMLLIVVDAHSKWIETFPMSAATSSATIQRLQILFAQFGFPDTLWNLFGQPGI